MIQCTTTRLAEMVLRISAVHRWCVTGTPVQRGLEGLYRQFKHMVYVNVFNTVSKPELSIRYEIIL